MRPQSGHLSQSCCAARPVGVLKFATMNQVSSRLAVLLLCASVSSLFAGDWPQWRGPDRSGHAAADAKFPQTLPAEPKSLWRLDIGGGFSSPVVAGGKLAYLDAQ